MSTPRLGENPSRAICIKVPGEMWEALEREAESALVMAEFSRSILSGVQMRLTDLLDMGLNTSMPAKRTTRRNVEPSEQLRLF